MSRKDIELMGLLDRFKKSLSGGSSASGPEAESADPGAQAPIAADVVEPSSESVGPGETKGFADDIVRALKAKVAELSNGQLGEEDLDANAMLFDFGYVDSLSAVTLISFVDSRYGVAVTELDLVGSLNNLQLLADHIQSERSG
jgi:acyl carrier protein